MRHLLLGSIGWALAAGLTGCAGPGFRTTTLETNATRSRLDMTARTFVASDPAFGAKLLQRTLPTEAIGATSSSLIKHIRDIGGACTEGIQNRCVINRREITQGTGGPSPTIYTSICIWKLTIAWVERTGPVNPRVNLVGGCQPAPQETSTPKT